MYLKNLINRKNWLILELILHSFFYAFYFLYHSAIDKEAILIKNDFASVSFSSFDNFIIRHFGQHQNKIDFWAFSLFAPVFLSLIHLYFIRKDYRIYKIWTYFTILFIGQIYFLTFLLVLANSNYKWNSLLVFIYNYDTYFDQISVFLPLYTFLIFLEFLNSKKILKNR